MFVHCNINQPRIMVDKVSLAFLKYDIDIINEIAFI